MKGKCLIASLFCSSALFADKTITIDVPMHDQGASTFYVQSKIHGSGEECLMLVDTGSGHSVINEATLRDLKTSGNAEFIKDLQGMMADGSTKIVPLYRISAITIGESCTIKNVEAAVLPDNSRQILGISTLQKAAPFGLSFDPPTLSLSGCVVDDHMRTAIPPPSPDSIPELVVEDNAGRDNVPDPSSEQLASSED